MPRLTEQELALCPRCRSESTFQYRPVYVFGDPNLGESEPPWVCTECGERTWGLAQ
jgi:uncharacterized protein with PIN domain